MGIFDRLKKDKFEELIFFSNPEANLKTIIAIHDTTLGPALGGCRMRPYSSEDEAIEDVLRLAEGMTYKAAISGLNLGGGKAIIIGDPEKDKTDILLRTFGRFVDSLGGRYITAEDMGTNVEDMDIIRLETKYVVGISASRGGGGDPSVVTAFGVYKGIKACLEEIFGESSLHNRTIVIQGLGNVGHHLVELLSKEKAKIFVTDINDRAMAKVLNQFNTIPLHPDEVYEMECDIFSPCAIGGIINDETISKFRCKIIAGSANNQLKEERHGFELYKRGILYAPDFVINSGGLINVAEELIGYNRTRALKTASKIYYNVQNIISISKKDKISTNEAAEYLAKERIRKIKEIKNISHKI